VKSLTVLIILFTVQDALDYVDSGLPPGGTDSMDGQRTSALVDHRRKASLSSAHSIKVKSFDVIVFDVLRVNPEDFAVRVQL